MRLTSGIVAPAQPEDVWRTGHPLCERAAIFFREGSVSDSHDAAGQNPGNQDNSVLAHVLPLPNASHADTSSDH